MVVDEAAHFSEHFAAMGEMPGHDDPVQEIVLPLHDESLHQLSELAQRHGIHGTNEYMRSVALQMCLDQFSAHCRERFDDIGGELRLSSGPMKPRPLCLFKGSVDELGRLEKELHCSETILLETAIRYAAMPVRA